MNGRDKEEGFTLLEVLLTLSIISLCVLLFSMAITQVKTVRGSIKDDRQIEWHLFLNSMEYDLIGTEFSDVTNTNLSVSKYNEQSKRTETVNYRIRNGEIARRVSGGNEPVLLELSKAEFEKTSPSRVRLQVTFNNGEVYTATIKVNEALP